MQGDAALAIGFLAGDLGAAETACERDLDALGTEAHRAADGLLHRAAESDAALELLSNVLSDERGVHIRLLDLSDVDVDALLRVALEACLDLLDARAAATDDHARLCRVDRELEAVLAALRLDPRNTGCLQAALQIITDLDIFMQVLCEIFICEPLGIPILDNAKTNTMRINFLTQTVSLLLSSCRRRRW